MKSKRRDEITAVRFLVLIAVVLTLISSLFLTSGNVNATIPQVSGLTAKLGSDNKSVILEWNSTANATQYRVYRGLDAGNLSVIALVSTTNYTDTDVVAGKTYYYAVQGINSTTAGTMSTVVNITIPSSPSSGGAGFAVVITYYSPFLWLGVFFLIVGILLIGYSRTSRKRKKWEGFGGLLVMFGIVILLASFILPYFHLL